MYRMKNLLVPIVLSVALLAVVRGESCHSKANCTLTTCHSSILICSHSHTCTCVTKCAALHEHCIIRDSCIHHDPCKDQGGCARDASGQLDYHCVDNRCHCGFK